MIRSTEGMTCRSTDSDPRITTALKQNLQANRDENGEITAGDGKAIAYTFIVTITTYCGLYIRI